tara:strand:- start:1820 stop:2482 length:663 start_codon:yes stop_codon:yes gene_type:complete
MYFSILPNLKYDKKQQSFPFSSSDYILVKNFFRRFQVNPDIFDYAVFYNKMIVENNMRIEQVADKVYGSSGLDWVVAVTNDITNLYQDWPVSDYSLQKWVESEYSDPYSTIRYYEIKEDVKNDKGTIFLKKGQKVDKTFYDGSFTYNNEDVNNSVSTIPGNTISKGISIFEDETRRNDVKREIYIIKGQFVKPLIADLKKQSTYNKCSAFVSKKVKETLV